jgi:hypothetical protein
VIGGVVKDFFALSVFFVDGTGVVGLKNRIIVVVGFFMLSSRIFPIQLSERGNLKVSTK